jgi:hypothetical protein
MVRNTNRDSGYSKRLEFSPTQPWRLFHPPAPESAKTDSSLCDESKQGRSERPKIILPSVLVDIVSRMVRMSPPLHVSKETLPTLSTSFERGGRGCPLLHASNEHRFIVRVLRARRAPGHSLPILLRPRIARAQGTHRAIPLPAGGLCQHSVHARLTIIASGGKGRRSG